MLTMHSASGARRVGLTVLWLAFAAAALLAAPASAATDVCHHRHSKPVQHHHQGCRHPGETDADRLARDTARGVFGKRNVEHTAKETRKGFGTIGRLIGLDGITLPKIPAGMWALLALLAVIVTVALVRFLGSGMIGVLAVVAIAAVVLLR